MVLLEQFITVVGCLILLVTSTGICTLVTVFHRCPDNTGQWDGTCTSPDSEAMERVANGRNREKNTPHCLSVSPLIFFFYASSL